MPVIIPEGFGQFTLRWSKTGDPEVMVTTCHYGSGDGLSAQVQSHANKVRQEWIDAFPNTSFADGYTFLGCRVLFNPTDGPLVAAEAVSSLAGVGTPNPLPTNCAFLVRKTTSGVGRKHKGRFYIPPFVLPELNVDSNGFMIAADVAAVQTRFTEFYEGISTGAVPLIVPAILHNDNSPVTLGDIVTAFQLQNQIATQRRRMR